MVKFAIGLPNLTSYDRIKSITLKGEELGYEGVFIGDHLRHSFESWTVLSALATETKKIKLGKSISEPHMLQGFISSGHPDSSHIGVEKKQAKLAI